MAQRKLQAEHDKLTKKVNEGMLAFEAIYEKLATCQNPSQKDKLEVDLKKEIKKLQRSRDTLKSWLAGSDFKDKRPLMEQRKMIEAQMEKFKVVEKEIKTKAFSKEGLQAGIRLDPREKEKAETAAWVSSMVEELERQDEQAEAEQEQLQAAMKKSKRDASRAERFEEISQCRERHKWHINKLELVLRLLENGQLEVEQVQSIKDDVQYYVESNQDPDFAEDDAVYDSLNLSAEEDVYGMEREESPDGSVDDRPPSPVREPLREGVRESKKIVKSPVTTVLKPQPKVSEPLRYASAAAAAGQSSGIQPLPPPSRKASIRSPTISKAITEGEVHETVLPPGLLDLVASFESAKRRSTGEDGTRSRRMFLHSSMQAPEASDGQRPRYYCPKEGVQVPGYYPQVPGTVFDDEEIYERVDVDTLFYIFYYQQGTYHQYLAARELKNQSWRFHKKYLTWFQRHEEPKSITDEYELGCYRYFDFEGSWVQRKKPDFKFQYSYLEDEL